MNNLVNNKKKNLWGSNFFQKVPFFRKKIIFFIEKSPFFGFFEQKTFTKTGFLISSKYTNFYYFDGFLVHKNRSAANSLLKRVFSLFWRLLNRGYTVSLILNRQKFKRRRQRNKLLGLALRVRTLTKKVIIRSTCQCLASA